MKKFNSDLLLVYELSHTYRDALIKDFEDNYDLPGNLNKTHLKTLLYIKFEKNPKMSLISSRMGLEKGSFTPVAQKLLELGYITKNKTDRDRRKSILLLTEKGKKAAEEYEKAHLEFLEQKFSQLSDEESAKLHDSLETVLVFTRKLLEE
ncbi:MAG TPA: MarR family transcriptional regulator [Clostridia bacterium]|nr:MarR family transcriptional regulator [Clostridia bacterium]HRX43294.1 MarR family transcriptional regulator [Clostridia bacterium]